MSLESPTGTEWVDLDAVRRAKKADYQRKYRKRVREKKLREGTYNYPRIPKVPTPDLWRDYESGMEMWQIGLIRGLAESNVYQRLRRAGMTFRSQRNRNER